MLNPGNDNRLEQLSRDAAEGFVPPGKPSWDKMEQELDKVLPVAEKKRRRIIFWWLFPVLVTGAGILWVSQRNDKTTQQQIVSKTTIENKPSNPEHSTKKAIKNVPEQITPASTDESVSVINEVEKTAKPVALPSTRITTTNPKQITAVIKEEQYKNETSVVVNKENDQQQVSNSTTQAIIATNILADQQKTIPASNTIKPTIDSGSGSIHIGIIEKVDTVRTDLNDSSKIVDLSNTDTIAKEITTPKSKFSFAFLAGIDASTVKFRHSDNAGINLGVLLGYHLNDRWSIHTGAIYTRKNYTVDGKDFTAPKNSWLANYRIDMVDGFCNMWEIPLAVRYTMQGNRGRSFFLSTGLSSYLMTRENYNYSYYYNGQYGVRNSNYPSSSSYLLSILKLSAGWVKPVGKASSFMIEPYASLPLTGLGYGSIRLSSFGLNFSLQIRQPSVKK